MFSEWVFIMNIEGGDIWNLSFVNMTQDDWIGRCQNRDGRKRFQFISAVLCLRIMNYAIGAPHRRKSKIDAVILSLMIKNSN